MNAPYKAGDRIRVLTAHPIHGTASATTTIRYIQQAPTSGEWTICWTGLNGDIHATRVNAEGHDLHGYVTPAQ